MSELIDALNQLEKEKNISKESIIDAIEKAVTAACEKTYGDRTDFSVEMDRETGEIHVYTHKTVVDQIMEDLTEISLEDARKLNPDYNIDDEVPVEITTRDFGRIAAQQARGIILQKIKEGEREAVFNRFKDKEGQIITGIVSGYIEKSGSYNITLDDKTDTILRKKDMIEGEEFSIGERVKLYVVEVRDLSKEPQKEQKDTKKKDRSKSGLRISVSRTHKEMVRRLFEQEVTEIADGTVEIKSVSREAGSRSKIAVWSNNPNVDAVGSCVGVNGGRVNSIVDELKGEKIDIIEWSEDPAVFIENALRPSDVVSVQVDEEARSAKVVVPDSKLSLAIGKSGQNAKLAAQLTRFKIDIKSESQAAEIRRMAEELLRENEEDILSEMGLKDEYAAEETDEDSLDEAEVTEEEIAEEAASEEASAETEDSDAAEEAGSSDAPEEEDVNA